MNFGENFASQIHNIPLLNDSTCPPIIGLSDDIQQQLESEIGAVLLAIQLD